MMHMCEESADLLLAGLTGMQRSAPKTSGGCTGRPPSEAPPASSAASNWGSLPPLLHLPFDTWLHFGAAYS